MKLGYSSDNRQDCTHCRFYLKDTPFQNDNAKLLLFRELARGWMIFLFLPRLQQPCHASMGPVRRRASMAAAEFSSHVILYHEFVHPEMKYLNFMIKLTIGIKSEGKHVQYCVNKIEVQ